MIRIGVLGMAGRMGRLIAEEIGAHPDCTLAGGLVRNLSPDLPYPVGAVISANIDEVIAASEVLIDVTLADAASANVQRVAVAGKAYVGCVTGLDDKTTQLMRQESSKIPLLYAPNTSLSFAATKRLAEMAARSLVNFGYDVTVVDEHHRMKKDAPSGAAKVLGEAVSKGSAGKTVPQYSSIRVGNIVGEHEVVFAGQGEVIRLHHSVTDRRIFARGALQAALWLFGKPKGFYGMDDVLSIG